MQSKVWESIQNLSEQIEELQDAARLLLARIQDEKGTVFWKRQPLTDLEEAAQKLAELVPPK